MSSFQNKNPYSSAETEVGKFTRTEELFKKVKVGYSKTKLYDGSGKLGPADYFDYDFQSSHFATKLLGVFFRRAVHLGWKTRFEGVENIPNDKNIILMPNHISHLDGPLAIIGATKRLEKSIDVIGDEKLFKNRFMRKFLSLFNAFPMKKGSKDIKIVDYAIKRSSKNSLLWFPEGQRHKNPSSNMCNPGKLGSGKIAHSAKSAIIPVFICGAEFAMPVGRKLTYGKGLNSIKILVKYGKPVYLDDLRALPPSKETSRLVVDRIMNHIEALRPKGPYRNQNNR
ncbi:MAG: 1-acyl-sn-glycerol-3-phosphate acyltransferase [Candidatus Heimdallarchaeota archaeon LC_2]|nr:MAG: 1-acyl-sn-glycerol-3-phosphate acyltransferase [Candidatus Heimdallarchaeota archaeon LC_2]